MKIYPITRDWDEAKWLDPLIYMWTFSVLPQRSFSPNWSTFGGSAFYPPSPHPGLHPPIHLDFFGILLHGFAWICIILHNFVYCRIFCILLPTFPPCQVSISHDLTLIPANAIVSPSLKKSNTKNTKTIEMAGTHPIRSCSNKCLKFLGKVIRKLLLSISLYCQSYTVLQSNTS